MKPNRKIAAALTFSAIALSGCYVVPVVDPQGNVQYQHYPLPPAGTQVVAAPAAYAAPAGYPAPHPGAAFPVVLNARLYPDNELASQSGVIVYKQSDGLREFDTRSRNESASVRTASSKF